MYFSSPDTAIYPVEDPSPCELEEFERFLEIEIDYLRGMLGEKNRSVRERKELSAKISWYYQALYRLMRPYADSGRRSLRGLEKGRDNLSKSDNPRARPRLLEAKIQHVQIVLNEQRQRSPELSINGMIAAAVKETGVSKSSIYRLRRKNKLTIPPKPR